MRLTSELTDSTILAELGRRLERRRINANLTQAQLAEEAGISKRTLERLESGASAEFVTLIRVLRALKETDGLEALIPDLPQSPLALLRQKGRTPKRASHLRRPAASSGKTGPQAPHAAKQ